MLGDDIPQMKAARAKVCSKSYQIICFGFPHAAKKTIFYNHL